MWLYRVSCGFPSFGRIGGWCDPWVGWQVLELAADQVAHGDQPVVGGITARTRLGGLNQAVHGLHKAVGKAGPKVFENAFQVIADGGAQSLERCQPGMARPMDPMLESGSGDTRIAGLGKDVTQGFLHAPGTCRFQV